MLPNWKSVTTVSFQICVSGHAHLGPWTRYQEFVQFTVSHTLLQGYVYHNLTARFAAALHAVQMAVFGSTAQALQHNRVKHMHKHVKALGLAQVHQHSACLQQPNLAVTAVLGALCMLADMTSDGRSL